MTTQYVKLPDAPSVLTEPEQAVIQQLRGIFHSPEMVAQTFVEAAHLETVDIGCLAEEKGNLESRLNELRNLSAGLMNSDPGHPDAEQIQRVNDEFIETQRRLQGVSEELARMQASRVSEQEVSEYLRRLDPIWEELYPLEQCRIVKLLVEQVVVKPDGMDINIRTDGVHSLISELRGTVAEHEGNGE